MERARIFLAAALLILVMTSVGYAFDIAIYSDPLSHFSVGYLWGIRFHNYQGGDYWDFLADTGYSASQMEDVYGWYREMGVTKVMVIYPYQWCFTQIPQDSSHIKVMNLFYPGLGTMHGEKYVDAGWRDVRVGGLITQNPPAYWSYENSIGDSARRTQSPPLTNRPSRQVVAMGPAYVSDEPGAMWKPTSYLGKFSGWDGLTTGFLDTSKYMPMHFKLTWAVDPNGPISIGDTLAEF